MSIDPTEKYTTRNGAVEAFSDRHRAGEARNKWSEI